MASGPLLLTKIEPPRLRTGHVARPELVERLRRGLHRRLTLIEAPAGSGKTTLLVEWRVAEEGRVPFAWLSLDDADNDPVRFWTYVSSALRHAGLDIPAGVDAAIAAPATTAREAGLPELVNALAGTGAGVVLVLDDFHLIREQAIHEDVAYFLERTPPGVHLAIASRAAPPVGVARLRVRGELGEVAEEELRFDGAGVGQLLNDGLGLTLADGDIDLLLERTEGWAAGLYLAGLSLQSRSDGAEFIASFSGAQRHLADYLLEEVLAGQPDELRRFLVQTSVLDRLSAPLCDALLGTGGSRNLLTQIERSNLFLIPLDSHREWFRYHHLFQDLLRLELGRDVTEEAIRALHARAAEWLAANGQIGEAIRHYLAAGHERDAADLIGASWNRFLQRGEVASATRWLDALPADVVLQNPQLGVARSWVALDVGDQALAERWLEAATRAAHDPTAPLAEGGSSVASGLAMLRATLGYQRGDLETARASAETAAKLEGESGSPWRAVALTNLGCSRYWQGDTDGARAALAGAVQLAEAGANSLAVLRSLSMLATIAVDAGDLAEAERCVAAATGLMRRENLGEYWMGALTLAASGHLAERAGDPAGAREAFERAAVLARRGVARPDLVYSLVGLAPRLAATGDAAAARDALREARQTVADSASPGVLPHLVANAERRVRGQAAPRSHVVVEDLSQRELAVLRLLPSELSLREIAGTLYISHNTVKTHAQRIYRKLGADTRAEAIARARELRLL